MSIPSLLAHERFELEVVLTHQEEVRMFRPGRAYRRRGWVVAGRSLASVEGSVTVACLADALALLPAGLPPSFDTGELAAAAGIDRRLAQQMTYCLRHAGGSRRRGNAGARRSTNSPCNWRAAFRADYPMRTCVRGELGPSQIDL